jgi:hypothetical protein
MAMKIKPLGGYKRAHDSTCIANSSYDKKGKRLTLTFASDGTTYEYSNVPQRQYLDLMDASSKGRLFNYDIRLAYPYAKRR